MKWYSSAKILKIAKYPPTPTPPPLPRTLKLSMVDMLALYAKHVWQMNGIILSLHMWRKIMQKTKACVFLQASKVTTYNEAL